MTSTNDQFVRLVQLAEAEQNTKSFDDFLTDHGLTVDDVHHTLEPHLRQQAKTTLRRMHQTPGDEWSERLTAALVIAYLRGFSTGTRYKPDTQPPTGG